MKAPQIASHAIKAALSRANIDPSSSDVDEVFLGNVVSAGIGQAPSKQAVLFSGLPNTIPCTTINKVCASGMKSTMFAAQSVMLQHQVCLIDDIFFHHNNTFPVFLLPGYRSGWRF